MVSSGIILSLESSKPAIVTALTNADQLFCIVRFLHVVCHQAMKEQLYEAIEEAPSPES